MTQRGGEDRVEEQLGVETGEGGGEGVGGGIEQKAKIG